MKIAVCSDEVYPVNLFIIEELKKTGHEVECFGALKTDKDEPWVLATSEAALAVSQGRCEEGIFFCWTGTGASIAANKTKGIRAALCTDAKTAESARLWNKANVLVLSNRLLSQDLAKEILTAWFTTKMDERSDKAERDLNLIESKVI